MKNKKLFAILTLVCFMMTLMPVAAFADEATTVPVQGAMNQEGEFVLTNAKANTVYTLAHTTNGKIDEVFGKAVASEKGIVTFDEQVTVEMAKHKDVEVDFTESTAKDFLEKAIAATTSGAVNVKNIRFAAPTTGYYAFEGNYGLGQQPSSGEQVTPPNRNQLPTGVISYDTSVFTATDGSDSIDVNDGVKYTVKLRDVAGNDLYSNGDALITIWAEEVSKPGITTSALLVEQTGNEKVAVAPTSTVIANGYDLGSVAYGDEITVKFVRPGEYRVFATSTANLELASKYKPSTTVDGVIKLVNDGSIFTVTSGSAKDPQLYYTATAKVTGATSVVYNNDILEGTDTPLAEISTAVANNVNDITVEVEFNNEGKDLVGKTVEISTNSANLNVSKTKATTNALGVINFAVSAAREGNYKVFLTVDGCTWVINVTCGNTSAAYIEVVEAPTALVALYGNVNTTTPTEGDLNVQVRITDINGNTVTDDNGVKGATTNTSNTAGDGNGKYVAFVKKPAASKLTNKDLDIEVVDNNYILDLNGKILDAEGDYEVKIVLDNGNFVTVPFTVKEFQTPVRLILAYPQNTIELGGSLTYGKLAWMDANGVMKAAKGIELAATGHAIATFNADVRGMVTVKSDEKYVGSTITVTAVDDRYDLIATATLTVADEAAGLAFSTETAEVNVNNKITVQVVDSQGKPVALGNNVRGTTDISYVVLDKPADAKVSVYTADDSKLTVQGKFVMALTSNKVGNVKVQAVVKLTTVPTGVGQTGSQTANVNQVKYYTGVQEFAVGTGEIGKSVVMSIGSNELIVGSKVEKMDAKPMIQNNRTYVPFRALAEAFGATVAYDQATSSVTAELNGVKVVMTVGSPVYTVNGVEKTADVAPFVADSRTFVPVRFAAEAFGIKVVPTYNEDGSVADVLFNM